MITKKRGIPVKKCTTDTCCLTLPLKLEKWQEDRLAKRFEIARQIYNTLVRAEFKKLNELERTPEYIKRFWSRFIRSIGKIQAAGRD